MVLRGGGGLFYDRPDGNTVFSIPGNPPIATSQDLRNGQLQTLGHRPQQLPAGPGADRPSSTTPKVPVVGAVAGRHPEDAALGDRSSTSPTSATTATTVCGAFQGGNARST